MSVAHGLAHAAQRLAVGLAAAHGERPVGADQLAEPGQLDELGLRDEDDPARADGAEHGDVDAGEVVHGEDGAALARDALACRMTRECDEQPRGELASRPLPTVQ